MTDTMHNTEQTVKPSDIRRIESEFQSRLARVSVSVYITGTYAPLREAQEALMRAAWYAARGIDTL